MSFPDESMARHEVEETLHTALYPGTEIMTDVGNVHFKHNAGHNVLVPQPSNDPNDPLNWSPLWKAFAMGGMAISAFTMMCAPLSVAPQVPYYMAEFNRPLPDVIEFIGVTILVLGFSNIIWVPFARAFGRRPMLTISTLVAIASNIWRARARSYGSFMGACVLSGIGTGPGETLGPMLIADVMFLHERGLYMGIYSWAAWGGVLLGPVFAGVTAQQHGWRAFWWICVGLNSFSLIYQLLFLPETKWNRSQRHEASNVAASPNMRNGLAQDDLSKGLNTSSASEKRGEEFSEGGTIAPETTEDIARRIQSTTSETVIQLAGKPNKRQFLIWTGYDHEERWLQSLLLPFKIFMFPIVQWSSFVFSWVASCFLVVNVTQSQALAGPPWNFTPANVGYTNFAVFGGASISLLTAGPLSDWVSSRATKRNRGIREPEMRLITMIPYACCVLVGSLIMAYGYQRAWPWEAIVIGGYTLTGIQLTALSAICTTYAIDSYKPVAGEFLVSATVNKNLWAYGMTKFLNVWIIKVGYVDPIMTNAALCLFFISLGIPLYFMGKRLRRYTANSSVHRAN